MSRRGRLSTICYNCVLNIDMINAICYDFSFENDVSRQDGDSINFFAVTLVAGLRQRANNWPWRNERLWSAVNSLQKTARTAKPGTRRELCGATIFLRAAVSEGNSDLD